MIGIRNCNSKTNTKGNLSKMRESGIYFTILFTACLCFQINAKDDGSISENPCVLSKCDARSKCILIDNEDGYICSCPTGWQGKFCDVADNQINQDDIYAFHTKLYTICGVLGSTIVILAVILIYNIIYICKPSPKRQKYLKEQKKNRKSQNDLKEQKINSVSVMIDEMYGYQHEKQTSSS
ncbi:delta and Notch-like epidermal growth factor-related receptor isoform X2 [Ruditapes philippinarum]|uniref:delta and Notch-like epidermal growth factor-related receptor isoform X2 n=1 Tax=Ruditapes philippinarum TaxID=129788 RepID=UPI00295C0B32|nr:delta and Notch-like epidermal growth factor-related receptor isoform X2 [Ruditapes philippinarum]